MASSRSNRPVAAWKYGSHIPFTARCAGDVRHPLACEGCADWSPRSSPTSADRDDKRVVVRRATLSLDSDLEPDRGPADASGPRRGVAHGSAAGRSIGRCGNPRRRGSRGEFHSRDRIVVAQPRTGGRCGPRRHPHRRVDRCRPCQAGLPASHQQALRARRPRGRKEGDRRRGAHHATAGARAVSTPFSPCTGRRWASRTRPRQSSKNFSWDQLPDLIAARVTAWAMTVACGKAGRTTEAVAAAEAGYPVAIRSRCVVHRRRPRRRTAAVWSDGGSLEKAERLSRRAAVAAGGGPADSVLP